ncbi:MAG: hypothetical protein V4805_01230 [Pseudomonadota bacterium]
MRNVLVSLSFFLTFLHTHLPVFAQDLEQNSAPDNAQEPPQPDVPDPLVSDGDKYKVILENARVRVLEYRDKAGDKTHLHRHPDFLLHALSPFKRKLTFASGKTVIREFKSGGVMWAQAQSHVGENIGTTETHAMIIELKEAPLRILPNNLAGKVPNHHRSASSVRNRSKTVALPAMP